MEFTQREIELLNKLLNNEALRQIYLLKTEQIKEVPEELITLLSKIEGAANEN